MIIRYTRKQLAEGNLKKKNSSVKKTTGDVQAIAKLLNKTRKEN